MSTDLALVALSELILDWYHLPEEMPPVIYDWFTEGFDTPDLRDARALLKEQR